MRYHPPPLTYCCVWKNKTLNKLLLRYTPHPECFPSGRGGGGGDLGYLSRSFNNSKGFVLDITRVFKRGRWGGSTLLSRGDPLPPNYTDFELFGSTDHLVHNQVDTHKKCTDSVKKPPKHHTIPADVLPNASEELLTTGCWQLAVLLMLSFTAPLWSSREYDITSKKKDKKKNQNSRKNN